MRTEGLARPASQGDTKAYHSGWPTEQTRWQQTCKDAKGGGEKPTSFGLMVIWYLPNGGKKRGDEVTGGKECLPAWQRGEGSEGIWSSLYMTTGKSGERFGKETVQAQVLEEKVADGLSAEFLPAWLRGKGR